MNFPKLILKYRDGVGLFHRSDDACERFGSVRGNGISSDTIENRIQFGF